MTTGIHPEATACLADWAARQLELKPDASAPEVRAAFLRRLEGEDFVPPWRWQQAYQLLERRPTDAPKSPQVGQVLQAEEDRLREEVEQFACKFFDLSSEERQSRWQELVQQCRFSPPLRSRLRGLEPGLQVDPAVAHDNPRVCQLAEHIRETFGLRPAARAASRQAFLRDQGSNQDAWELAAGQLQQFHPALAVLEPTLIRQLRSLGERQHRRARLTWARATRDREAGAPHLPNHWKLGLLVMLILGAVKGVSSLPNSNRNTYSPPPVYSPYNYQDPLKTPPTQFSKEEWEAINKSLTPRTIKSERIKELLKKMEEERRKQTKDPDAADDMNPRPPERKGPSSAPKKP